MAPLESKTSVSVIAKRPVVDQIALRRAFSKPVVLRALGVAFVVGSILNAINQGDALVDGKSVDILKLLPTYAVPYFVATYGAYSAFRNLDARDEQ